MKERIEIVDLDQVVVKDHAHRTKLDIESLAESIGEIGQINPIAVKRVGSKYQVIAGRRRYTALKHLEKVTGKPQKVAVIVKDLDAIQEELVFIDENLMREDLSKDEFDETLFRRKQLFEQLHPETKKGVAGAVAKHSGKPGKSSFASDAASRLKTSKRTVEKAIARAERATDAVKAARKKGELSPSKVDLLVTLPGQDQDYLLPLAKKSDVREVKEFVELARKKGARAVLYYLEEQKNDSKELKDLARKLEDLNDTVKDLIREEAVFVGENRTEHLRALEETIRTLTKFVSLQKAQTGHVQAIRRRAGEAHKILARA
jgi:ParB family chromosome partitioning protein